MLKQISSSILPEFEALKCLIVAFRVLPFLVTNKILSYSSSKLQILISMSYNV